MKKKILRTLNASKYAFMSVFTLVFTANHLIAQQPIILTYKNFLMPPSAEYIYQGADINGVAVPAKGENKIWDYSKLQKNDSFNYSFSVEPVSNVVYPNAFRKYVGYFFVGDIPIAIDVMEGNNMRGSAEVGNHFSYQAFSLLLLTGNPTDSLIIPEQDVVVKPEVYRQYPLEYGSSTTSNSVYTTNFILNIEAFGLDHVPGQFVQHVRHKRDVVGWGKLRIPTENGPSSFIKVLMQKLNVLRTDSVYLGGEPADSLILAAFGITQGQTVNSYYQYRFHQKGIDAYLANFSFTNDTYSTLSSIQYDTKYYDVQCDNGVNMCVNNQSKCIPYLIANDLLFKKDATVGNCSSVLRDAVVSNTSVKVSANAKVAVYPNPSSSQFTLNIPFKPGNQVAVSVFDISGRMILHFNNVQSDKLVFGNNLKAGTYIIQIIGGGNKQTIKAVKSN